jgi:3-hydroxy acid dehydrogenase / malonic semialdehyde reductase
MANYIVRDTFTQWFAHGKLVGRMYGPNLQANGWPPCFVLVSDLTAICQTTDCYDDRLFHHLIVERVIHMIAFITGATAGYGYATARKFLTEGWSVVAAGRRAERIEPLRAEFGNAVLPLKLDVTRRDDVLQAVNELPSAFRDVDVLVNNAGGAYGLEPAQQANLDDWDTMVDINIRGVMYCTRALLPGMVERNRGHVVNIGSVAGEFPYPGGNVYGGVKAFTHQFSLNLRSDLLGTAVRVTCLEPGLTGGTEFSEVRFRGDRAKAASVYAGADAMTADDIAETVYWITTRPARVNINTISMMATCQAFSSFAIHRKPK